MDLQLVDSPLWSRRTRSLVLGLGASIILCATAFSVELPPPPSPPEDGTLHHHRTLEVHSSMAVSVSISPDGRVIASAGGEPFERGDLILWNAAEGTVLDRLEGPDDMVVVVAFSPDGKFLASTYPYIPKVILWDVEERKEIFAMDAAVGRLAWTPDGSRLAVSEGSAPLILLEAPTWEASELAISHDGAHTGALAFSPDGKRLATASAEMSEHGEVKIWDVESGKELAVYRSRAATVEVLAFSPDGTKLATGSAGWIETGNVLRPEIRIWDLTSGTSSLLVADPDRLTISGLAFSPDGSTLYAGYLGSAVIVWDLEEMKESERVELAGRVNSLALSQDAGLLAAATNMRTIEVWKIPAP